MAQGRRRGEEGWLAAVLVRLALVEWEAGNWNESDRYLAEAGEAARQQLDDEMDSWIAHADGQLAASRAQLERARFCADEVLRLSKANRDVQLQRDGDVLLAEVELFSGEPEAPTTASSPSPEVNRRRSVLPRVHHPPAVGV
jgi:hypothetical protein